MAENERSGLDRGAMDMRGLLCVFIGLAGALVFYANDDDGTRAAVWLVLFAGGGVAMIARAFRQEKLAAVIVVAIGIVAGGLLYAGDGDNRLVAAIIVALAGVASGTYLMLVASSARSTQGG